MASTTDKRPLLATYPPDDVEFRTWASALVRDGATTPALLERRLRDQHPRAVVRRRDLVGEQVDIWYVYRDGGWSRPTHQRGASPLG